MWRELHAAFIAATMALIPSLGPNAAIALAHKFSGWIWWTGVVHLIYSCRDPSPSIAAGLRLLTNSGTCSRLERQPAATSSFNLFHQRCQPPRG